MATNGFVFTLNEGDKKWLHSISNKKECICALQRQMVVA